MNYNVNAYYKNVSIQYLRFTYCFNPGQKGYFYSNL